MPIQLRTFLVALMGIALGIATPAFAQREVENAPDPYVHRAVGVAFPEQVGSFERTKVVEFNADGSDAAIAYRPVDLVGEISLYVYPLRGQTCEEQFEGAHEAVMQRGASVLSQDTVFSIPAFSDATQFSRSYRIEAGGYGYDHAELISFLWVGCPVGSNSIVKYRGSYLASDAMEIIGIEQGFFADIDWSPLTRP